MVIYRHKEKYSVSEMCRFFDVSRSGYYGYVSRMDTPAKDLPLAEKIRECQEKCGQTYGYRRVHIWLKNHSAGYAEIRLAVGYQEKEIPQLRRISASLPKPVEQELQSRSTESKVGHGHLIHQDRTRNAVSVCHS